jgi:putative hemolysin
MALYEALRDRYLVEPSLRTEPRTNCRCEQTGAMRAPPSVPWLFRAYLNVSARLCGPPAINREFKTIDFLTLLDFKEIPPRLRSRFF